MAGVGEPPVEEKPTETLRPAAFWHLVGVIVYETGKAVGADVAVKKASRWVKGRGKARCSERGKPVKKSWDFCPKCGEPMPRPPALHP